jgi:hypothetical protein
VPPLDDAAAAELFVARACQVKPDFEPDSAARDICRRLDGLPLALEHRQDGNSEGEQKRGLRSRHGFVTTTERAT